MKPDWDEALDLVASQLISVRDTHGPQSVGFIGSSKASNEEAYLNAENCPAELLVPTAWITHPATAKTRRLVKGFSALWVTVARSVSSRT